MCSRHSIAVLVLVALLYGCTKDSSSDISGYSYLSSSLQPYLFKSGSYWVFANDATGQLDSVAVLGTQQDLVWSPPPVHGQPGTKREFFRIDLHSSYYSSTFNDYLISDHIKRNGGGEYGQLGQPFFTPTGSGFNGMSVIEDLDTLSVNDSIFHGIRVTKVIVADQYQDEFEQDTYFYYSSDVGLVRRVVDLGGGQVESWSLKRWSIIR